MPYLKDRQRQIPGGFVFHDSVTGWRNRAFMSFDVIVRGAISARQANPQKTATHNLSLNYNEVAIEVEAFNVALCVQNGWNDFITSSAGGQGNPAPFRQRTPQLSAVVNPPTSPYVNPRSLKEKSAQLVAGSGVIVDWLKSGAESVSKDVSNARAKVCAMCPLNQAGGLETFFTLPIADAIRKTLNFRSEIKLETPFDPVLGTCEACGCVLKLKVHLPIEKIKGGMQPNEMDSLHASCWIRSESK